MPTPAESFALAARHHDAGDLARAEECCLSIVRENPGHANALHMLGAIAWQRSNLALAIDYLQRAVSLAPGNATAWKHLGDVCLVAGNPSDAAGHYEQILRLRPDFAQAYDDLGNALRAQGKLAQATEAFRQALALQPGDARIAYKLGVCLHEQGKLDEAVPFYQQALKSKPDFADAANSLGTVYKEQGLLDEALALFREAVRIQPEHSLACYNLSKFAAEGRYEFTPEEIERVKMMMTSERAPPSDRSQYGFALGSVLHKQGRYDEAFAAYREANDLRKRLLAERGQVFDAAAHAATIERIIATYDRAYFERVRGWGIDTELPVFIVGMPRSGSSVIEQILASHPQVYGAGEVGEAPLYLPRFVVGVSPELYTRPLLPDRQAAQAVATDYIERITRLGNGAARVTIKTLQNFMHLGLIATLFPRACVIHSTRDAIDACLSCYFQNFENIDFASSLEDIGAYYRAYDQLMAHWAKVLPLEIHAVANEDLIQNQEAVTRRLLAACGLAWDERCMTFYSTRRVVQTASSVQVRKPVSGRSVGRWKQYQGHLGPLLKALGRQT